MIPDAYIVVEMSDEDLDRLAAASEGDYWGVLNTIVGRIEMLKRTREAA